MYEIDSASLARLRQERWSGIGPNVFHLGLTSLLTDVSSEMVTAILPLYFIFALGLSPLQFGLIDGLQHGVVALARLASGLLADRRQRHREVAAAGYALSAACKLGLLAAGNAWGVVSAVIALDRIGKGIRTAPRDALVSMSCEPARLGLAFGVHRAMDTAGALLGPLLAFGLLALLPNAFDLVFVTSFFIAVAGVAALLLLVRNLPESQALARCPPERVAALAQASSLLRMPAFRRLLLASSLLALASVGDAFFYLLLQRRMPTAPAAFPLYYVATSVSYLLLAVPAGRLGDRIGRGRVFLVGHGLLLLACVHLLSPSSALFGGGASLLSLALLGACYACTDGVVMAAASRLLPSAQRATGLAILAAAIGLARLLSSVIFGGLWNWCGAEAALAVFTLALAAVLPLAARGLAPSGERRSREAGR